MNSKEDWYKLIRESPQDKVLQLAFADWLEEHDELLLARAWRWLEKRGYYPSRAPSSVIKRKDLYNSFDWW